MKKFVVSVLLFLICLCSVFVFAEESDNKFEISQNVQLAMANSEYPVTIGDVYLLNFAVGGKAVSYTILIDSTYKVRVANLAILDSKGKTYLELKKQVEEIVQKNYPMSGVQFVLNTPGTFKIIVSGEVNSVHEKTVWSLSRLSSVLKDSLTEFSSTRNIKIVRGNKEIICDLYKFSRYGDFSQNPYLKNGDEIIIDRFDRKVSIKGAVEREGTYELFEGENLKDLIQNYGHGLKINADLNHVEISKLMSESSNLGEKKYLTKEEAVSDYKLECYDSVFIPYFSINRAVVFVEGAINSSAKVNLDVNSKFPVYFTPGTDYADFVRSNSSWFSPISDIENAYIQRGEEKIPFNISIYLYGEKKVSKVILKENDLLMIPYKQFFVTVSGSVYKPGRYPYIPNRTYDYYVALAGGIIAEKNVNSSVKITDIEGKKLSKSDFITPESNIFAKSNSFTYYFSIYAPIVTTVLSLITTTITVNEYLRR